MKILTRFSWLFFATALVGTSLSQDQGKKDATKLQGGWPPQKVGDRAGGPVRSKADGKKLQFFDEVDVAPRQEPLPKPDRKVNRDLLAINQPSPENEKDEDRGKDDGSGKDRDSEASDLPLPPLPKRAHLPPLPKPRDDLKSPLPKPRSRPAPRRDRSVYTLGPGDLVTFATYDREDLSRTVTIAPDGTVSYLQAVAVNAKGLTVEQLRNRMEDELRKYRRDIKIIVNPQLLQSKEFSVLGRVRKPGTFTLDRPTTVLEGIARAEGVEIGTIRGSAYGLADFERSFVSRRGRKLNVDLSKLYYEGDLSQNVYLQPDDYLYVASALNNEIYVIGSVANPGRFKLATKLNVSGAISLAGGFTKEAYKMKVLIIRGDIDAPEVEIVNMRDVLKGKLLDVRVKSRDIIFVNKRPFEMVERVLDTALTTYMQTVTAELMNQNYTPFSL